MTLNSRDVKLNPEYVGKEDGWVVG